MGCGVVVVVVVVCRGTLEVVWVVVVVVLKGTLEVVCVVVVVVLKGVLEVVGLGVAVVVVVVGWVGCVGWGGQGQVLRSGEVGPLTQPSQLQTTFDHHVTGHITLDT